MYQRLDYLPMSVGTEPAVASRREHILRVALRLLGSEGPAGVTHRTVAAEAEVPLAATTYYFESKQAMLQEALALLAGEEVARLEAIRAALDENAPDARAVAQGIATELAELVGVRGALAKIEIYLDAARREDLRSDAAAAVAAFVDLGTDLFTAWGVADPRATAEIAVAGIDGLILHETMTGAREVDRDRLATQLERLLVALRDG